MGTYQVKNVKIFRGHDGHAFNSSLYCDGKRVATVDDDGWGGECRFQWLDYKKPKVEVTCKHCDGTEYVRKCTPAEAAFLENLKGRTYEYGGKLNNHNPDTYVGELIQEFETQKQYRKWCKGRTVFRLKGDKEGEWRTIGMPWSDPRTKPYIDKKYGSKVEEILNEKI